MTGVEPPIPGKGAFHTMFLVALHSVGTLVSLLTPSLAGPRHEGQFSAWTSVEQERRTVKDQTMPGMRFTTRSPRGGTSGAEDNKPSLMVLVSLGKEEHRSSRTMV